MHNRLRLRRRRRYWRRGRRKRGGLGDYCRRYRIRYWGRHWWWRDRLQCFSTTREICRRRLRAGYAGENNRLIIGAVLLLQGSAGAAEDLFVHGATDALCSCGIRSELPREAGSELRRCEDAEEEMGNVVGEHSRSRGGEARLHGNAPQRLLNIFVEEYALCVSGQVLVADNEFFPVVLESGWHTDRISWLRFLLFFLHFPGCGVEALSAAAQFAALSTCSPEQINLQLLSYLIKTLFFS